MRAVLLDVDGVLLDSTDAFRVVWQSWASRHELDFDVVWAATHGRRPVDTIEEVAKHLNSSTEYELLQILVDDPALVFPPVDGARDLLDSLPEGRWALVTSSHSEKVRARFKAATLPLPRVVVGGDTVAHGKPSPDCYLLAADLVGTKPASCLVIEDAPAGVEAALAAGTRVVGVTTTHDATSLRAAHAVAQSLEEVERFVEEWFVNEPRGSRHGPTV